MKYLLIVFFSLINIISLSKSEKLIFVELQSRHGARGPLDLNEKNEDLLGEKWSSLGELSGVGQRMEYILGLRNRQRYITNKKFLSEKFDPHEILVYSTSINRTLLSMASQLQGLYPISLKLGETLNSKQLEFSNPPIDFSYEEIEQEISRLENCSLPNYMTMIPIHMINPFEKKIVVYDNIDCKPNVDKITDKNLYEKEPIHNITNFFNEKYAKNLSKYYDKPEDFKYEFENISKICDAFIADYTERRPMTQFLEKTNINDIETFIEDCKEFIGVNFKEKLFGDHKLEVLSLEASGILKEMLHYMKVKVNEDINKEKILFSDYSKPKMVIISGHDTTLAAQILFLIKIFKLDIEIYKLPAFSSQVAVEVSRDENEEGKEFKDYSVKVYYNDDLFLNITMDEFIQTVEDNLWSQERIDLFCYGDNNENIKFNANIIIIISISIIVVVLLIIIIILINKIGKKEENDVDSIDSDNLINDD